MASCDISGGRLHLVKYFEALKDHWASNDSGLGVHISMLRGAIREGLTASPSNAHPTVNRKMRFERPWRAVVLSRG